MFLTGIFSGVLTVIVLIIIGRVTRRDPLSSIPRTPLRALIDAVAIALIAWLLLGILQLITHSQTVYGLDWAVGDFIGLFVGYLIANLILRSRKKAKTPAQPVTPQAEPNGFVGEWQSATTYEQPPR